MTPNTAPPAGGYRAGTHQDTDMTDAPAPSGQARPGAPWMPAAPAPFARLNRSIPGWSAPASFVRFHRWIYRASHGWIGHGMIGSPCLILTTTGRRSGQPRHQALVYLRDGDNYVVAGSNDAKDRDPQWVRNIEADPRVTVLVRRARLDATAAPIRPGAPGYDRLWDALNRNTNDRYQRYQDRTSRPIPLVVIDPVRAQAVDDGAGASKAVPAG